jgi:hypothetical protein
MKLSELIAAYGDANVKLQTLDDCADTLNFTAKKGTRITFGAPVSLDPNGLRELGLVVWMDRKRVQEIIDANTNK